MRASKLDHARSDEVVEPAERRLPGTVTPGSTAEHDRLRTLQRLVGNAAVSAQLAPSVQRQDSDDELSDLTELSDAEMEEEEGEAEDEAEDEDEIDESEYGRVVSGHGRFNENRLAAHPTQRRKKAGQFEVPEGMQVRIYAPPGSALDNAVANRIESGDPPSADELELVHKDRSDDVRPVPTPYPYVFDEGDLVIDYTVSPPDRLSLRGSPVTVTTPTPLRALVAQAEADGITIVHYACCGSSYAPTKDFEGLFTHKSYYVRLKHVESDEDEESTSD